MPSAVDHCFDLHLNLYTYIILSSMQCLSFSCFIYIEYSLFDKMTIADNEQLLFLFSLRLPHHPHHRQICLLDLEVRVSLVMLAQRELELLAV